MMMAGQSNGTTLVQEREDLMVSSSSSGTPILRLAHFLTPSHNNSIHGSAIHPPPKPVSSSDLDTEESHVSFNFCRWKNPLPDWKEWVDLMYSKHETLWKKVGIFEAVLNSKYTIHRDDKLLHDIASKWCSETNTFVFPWGEATLTLEDMIMLGGYSVLGDPVFSPLDTQKMKAIEKKLEHERSELSKTKAKKACHGTWLGKFMNSGNEIEHEAFLVYWLSRFVFTLAEGSIVKCVIPIAVQLSNGIKIALAPAVLASIYSDLNAYIKAVGSKYQARTEDVLVSSPFNLIQIWVWERFPLLHPKPKNVKPEEPSFAKWHELKRNGGGNFTNVTDKVVADSFIWRPYTTICGRFSPSGSKGGKEQCISVTSGTDEEVDALIKCLRVSELVGIDSKCIEQYLPHRVARQFRLDQDIPAVVERANKLAWENYNRPIENRRFYIPSHLYEPNVTVRYLDWWKKKPVSTQDVQETSPDLKKQKLMDSAIKKPKDEVCDLVDTTWNVVKEKGSRDELESCKIGGSKNRCVFGDSMSYKRLMKRLALKSAANKPDVDVDVPPGFLSKCNNDGARSSYAKDVEKESISKAFVERMSNLDEQNEVKSIPCLSKDSLMELEARITNAETILARYKKEIEEG